jgi:hypothetical protein
MKSYSNCSTHCDWIEMFWRLSHRSLTVTLRSKHENYGLFAGWCELYVMLRQILEFRIEIPIFVTLSTKLMNKNGSHTSFNCWWQVNERLNQELNLWYAWRKKRQFSLLFIRKQLVECRITGPRSIRAKGGPKVPRSMWTLAPCGERAHFIFWVHFS